MSWSKQEKRWELVNLRESELPIAYFPSLREELPIGTHEWTFIKNRTSAGLFVFFPYDN